MRRLGTLLVALAALAAAGVGADSSSDNRSSEFRLQAERLRRQLTHDNSDYEHDDSAPDPTHDPAHDPAYDPAHDSNLTQTRRAAHDHQDASDYNMASSAPDEPTYQILKSRRQHRRSGGRGAGGALVREQRPGAVSLLSARAGPFPELRLARARRQYRREPGAADSEEDGEPPPRPLDPTSAARH